MESPRALSEDNASLAFSHVFNSHVQLFATLWTIARQAPLSMGSPRQEYWSGLPFPPSGDLPDSGIELMSPALADGLSTTDPQVKPSG